MDQTEALLKEITEAPGVPGYDGEARAVIPATWRGSPQFLAIEGGATDGGMIHIHAEGVPAVVIGVPTRRIHSHVGILHRDDYDHALELVVALVKKLDQATVEELTV